MRFEGTFETQNLGVSFQRQRRQACLPQPRPFLSPTLPPPPSIEHLMCQVWLRIYIFHFICIVLSLNGHMCLVVSILDSRDLHNHRSQALFGPHKQLWCLSNNHGGCWLPSGAGTHCLELQVPPSRDSTLCLSSSALPLWTELTLIVSSQGFFFLLLCIVFLEGPSRQPTQQQPVSTQICLSTQQHVTSKASCLVLELLARLFFTNKENLSK